MNAVERFAAQLPVEAVRRLAATRLSRFERHPIRADARATADEARAVIAQRWGDDLCAFINAMTKAELGMLECADRLALWLRGAALERGAHEVSRALQPVPVLVGGNLVIEQPPRGMYPASAQWPRETPDHAIPRPPEEEPDSVDELLVAADRAIGVRLGARGADKGAWGVRAAELLGVLERNDGEPDWRGDVEIKTVAITRDRASNRWRIVDDPAIAMLGEPALAKLQRTLWLARTDLADGDATIVAWYLLECDAEVARMLHRYLHVRPKGPAGTEGRGVYLHKRFFADAGLLAVLNGPPAP